MEGTMRNKWFWRPVIVGAIIFAVLGYFFTGYMFAVLTCPGLKQTCLSPTQTLFTDILQFAWPSIPVGGLIGAGLGTFFAVIRKRVWGKGEEASQSE
jgi:hypothetical protein